MSREKPLIGAELATFPYICFIKAFICAAGARADARVVFFGVCVCACVLVCVCASACACVTLCNICREYINFLALILMIERDILSKEV